MIFGSVYCHIINTLFLTFFFLFCKKIIICLLLIVHNATVDAHSSPCQWTTSSVKWELHFILFIYFSAFSAKPRHIMVSHACLWIKNIVPLQGMLCFGHTWNQTLVRPFPSLRLYRRLCIFVKFRPKQARHDKGKAQINMSCQSVEKAWERQGTNNWTSLPKVTIHRFGKL